MKKKNIIYQNGLVDLAQARLGSKIVYRTDEFFAPAKRIINPWPPVFKEGVFDKHGKWMDGWETRRKRSKGHDFLILKLGKPGIIKKIAPIAIKAPEISSYAGISFFIIFLIP